MMSLGNALFVDGSYCDNANGFIANKVPRFAREVLKKPDGVRSATK